MFVGEGGGGVVSLPSHTIVAEMARKLDPQPGVWLSPQARRGAFLRRRHASAFFRRRLARVLRPHEVPSLQVPLNETGIAFARTSPAALVLTCEGRRSFRVAVPRNSQWDRAHTAYEPHGLGSTVVVVPSLPLLRPGARVARDSQRDRAHTAYEPRGARVSAVCVVE